MPNFKEEFRRRWEEMLLGSLYVAQQMSLGLAEVVNTAKALWANDWIRLTVVWFTVLLLVMTR